jgi:hypothetical protein
VPFDDAENLERTIIIEHLSDEGIQTGPRRGNEVQEKKADKHEGKGNGDDRKKTLVHDLAEGTVCHEHHDNYPNDVKAATNQEIQPSHEMKLDGGAECRPKRRNTLILFRRRHFFHKNLLCFR